MPSFNQTAITNRARNANSVVIMIGDQPIGFAQTTQHTMAFGAESFYGVGSASPQEIQQLKNEPSITLDAFALTDNGLAVLGYPSTIAAVLANNQFNLYVVDGASGEPIFTYVGCVAGNFSESIPANQPVSDSISFTAMDVLDSTGQSIMNVGSAYQFPSTGSVAPSGGIGVSVSAGINVTL